MAMVVVFTFGILVNSTNISFRSFFRMFSVFCSLFFSSLQTALFDTIMVLEKGGGGGGGDSGGGDTALLKKIDELLEILPAPFNEVEIRLRATGFFDENAANAPYILVGGISVFFSSVLPMLLFG